MGNAAQPSSGGELPGKERKRTHPLALLARHLAHRHLDEGPVASHKPAAYKPTETSASVKVPGIAALVHAVGAKPRFALLGELAVPLSSVDVLPSRDTCAEKETQLSESKTALG